MITDLIILWSLFSDVVEVCTLKTDDSAIRQDQRLLDAIDAIFIEGGEFWASPSKAVGSLQRVTWSGTGKGDRANHTERQCTRKVVLREPKRCGLLDNAGMGHHKPPGGV
jgi:hypothetical protein